MAFNPETRRAELQAIYDEDNGSNWAAIKAIAEPLGITKPDSGWEDAIGLIVEAESKPQSSTQTAETLPTDTPWRKPRTDLHGNLIPDPWQS
ncbi:MAG: hypothetical protein F6K11_18865 [Leptolyngbya sp. SIO3F4]|nr:hypothetical protein [Leptolyngbya sp. SIO3F4]